MNHVFRIIWSYALRTWVAASKPGVRQGKCSGTADKRMTFPGDEQDGNAVGASPPTAWPSPTGADGALRTDTSRTATGTSMAVPPGWAIRGAWDTSKLFAGQSLINCLVALAPLSQVRSLLRVHRGEMQFGR